MRKIRRLAPVLLATVLASVAVSPSYADETRSSLAVCPGMVYNACFYSGAGFSGTEHPTLIAFVGCRKIPASQSYSVSVDRTTTLYSGDDCTGQTHDMIPGFGWEPLIGFTARSYYYPPA